MLLYLLITLKTEERGSLRLLEVVLVKVQILFLGSFHREFESLIDSKKPRHHIVWKVLTLKEVITNSGF